VRFLERYIRVMRYVVKQLHSFVNNLPQSFVRCCDIRHSGGTDASELVLL
jgi:hypothetical protein